MAFPEIEDIEDELDQTIEEDKLMVIEDKDDKKDET